MKEEGSPSSFMTEQEGGKSSNRTTKLTCVAGSFRYERGSEKNGAKVFIHHVHEHQCQTLGKLAKQLSQKEDEHEDS